MNDEPKRITDAERGAMAEAWYLQAVNRPSYAELLERGRRAEKVAEALKPLAEHGKAIWDHHDRQMWRDAKGDEQC